MAQVTVESRYLSAGANRYTAAADWGDDGLVAFAADSNICIWNPAESRGISHILSGHKAHVRAVKFLPKLPDDPSTSYLVSGGDDKTLRLWALETAAPHGAASCLQTVEGHTAPINCIAALALGSDTGARPPRPIFVSGAADATIKVWTFGMDGLVLLQTIKTPKKYLPLALALSPLGDDGLGIVLAVAGTTNVVDIFMASKGETGDAAPQFTLQATLPGHENWVRSLDFVRESPEPGSDLLLASASQDKYIRLCRLHQGSALSALGAAGMAVSSDALTPGNKIHKIVAGATKYCIMFEALLLGHEDWIYSAKWSRAPPTADDARGVGKLQLLSASADNSLSIWESDQDSGIWITGARLGEVSREKGATTATGSIGGFWAGLWSPSGTTVVTMGRTGSWRRWDYDAVEDMWKQNIAVSGHTRAVTGISWSRDGAYLLSTSSDQTTRVHAEWARPAATGSSLEKTWHEMSRPQIHGYDLNCIDSLGASSFVSGADEKLMRVFTEPKAVAVMLNRLTGAGTGDESQLAAFPDAANMPVLGLSNKAIDVVDDDAALAQQQPPADDREAVDPANVVRKSALDIDHPPFEESLSRHTLWPEVEKLYGHGYEISCLATSHDGRLVASACKASSVNHAVIRLFETEHWTEIKPPLTAHSLTVTRLRFSPDDSHLLSVGRDRQWAIFARDPASTTEYKLLQANPKGHARMILDAAWAPPLPLPAAPQEEQQSLQLFATAGRDRQVMTWVKWRPVAPGGGCKDEFVLAGLTLQGHAVTALDFFPTPSSADGSVLLAVGSEAGHLSLFSIAAEGGGGKVSLSRVASVAPELCLPKAVLQLAWRPPVGRHGRGEEGEASSETDGGSGDQQQQGNINHELAIAGADGSLRIYSVSLGQRMALPLR
ncbi:WD40-repeat-containing domain protein [Lasiosphaeria ovina]|uniref:Elongator complex protein 2 n=1 Tax=Lasiosphaeria ovina TaxID=92902 RepID=A0AAE0JX17_9PEZI|nr:WD40-repeat-containing domain protein [Lasiosphaeria ovina]